MTIEQRWLDVYSEVCYTSLLRGAAVEFVLRKGSVSFLVNQGRAFLISARESYTRLNAVNNE